MPLESSQEEPPDLAFFNFRSLKSMGPKITPKIPASREDSSPHHAVGPTGTTGRSQVEVSQALLHRKFKEKTLGEKNPESLIP